MRIAQLSPIALVTVAVPALAQAQTAVSAPLSNIEYRVLFDRTTAEAGTIRIDMRFQTAGSDPVLLSLPAWTPGAYEISNFARNVLDFRVVGAGRAVRWDKMDYDTWRIHPAGATDLTVSFDYRADSLDNAMAWSQPDFVLFNGTNVFLYPEGRGYDFPATVTFATEADWKVSSGFASNADGAATSPNYHDLVDRPVFIGDIDVDSAQVDGVWNRIASYPSGVFAGTGREELWSQIHRMMPPMHAVFGETPWDHYTTLLIFTDETPGGSALEHGNSHVGIYNPGFIGNVLLASITAHEIFHAWNVKRLRPVDMVPYVYNHPQPTTLLWVSEGITDYYADLALVRGQIIAPQMFYSLTANKVDEVSSAGPVSLEDASLSTWIDPIDGTRYIYYPKGSLAGLLIDILIRDASNNLASLDDVMRDLYTSSYKEDIGFTTERFWTSVTSHAGSQAFEQFHDRYIDGREPFPIQRTLALAGLRLQTDSAVVPVFGIGMIEDSVGVRIVEVEPGSAADIAGVQEDDYLVALGGIDIADPSFPQQFQRRFGRAPHGTDMDMTVRRGSETLALPSKLMYGEVVTYQILEDPRASPTAMRIREGILTGR